VSCGDPESPRRDAFAPTRSLHSSRRNDRRGVDRRVREDDLGAAPGKADFTGSVSRRAARACRGRATGDAPPPTRSAARSMARHDSFGIRCSPRSRQSSAETGSDLCP
jgi:hypothetical protein